MYKRQDYSKLQIKGAGSYFTEGHEIYGSAGIAADKYHLYDGGNSIDKKEIEQKFNNIFFTLGAKNTTQNDLKINYDPNLRVDLFSLADKLSETNLLFNLPASSYITENIMASVALNFDLSKINNKAINIGFTNNIVSIQPAVTYAGNAIKLRAGLSPTWDNGEMELLPDFFAEVHPEGKNFTILGGYKGELMKNSFKRLAGINPYIEAIRENLNTSQTELFGGIRTTFAERFQFNGRVGIVRYKNLPLFIKYTDPGFPKRNFTVANESRINNLRISSELSYTCLLYTSPSPRD